MWEERTKMSGCGFKRKQWKSAQKTESNQGPSRENYTVSFTISTEEITIELFFGT